jgi:long-chain acyl-CoA synthetase
MKLDQKNNSFIIDDQKEYTAVQFKSDVIRHSMVLLKHGVQEGDRVTLCCPNNYSFLVSLFSLMHVNCSIVLLDPDISSTDFDWIHKKTRSHWILSTENAGVEHTTFINLHSTIKAASTISQQNDMDIDLTQWYHRRDAVILFSSGSTGLPKGIMKSGASLFLNMYSTAIGMRYNHDEVILPVVPFFNIWGLNMIIQWWVTGGTLIVCDYQSTRTLPSIINQRNVSVVEATIATTYLIVQLAERNVKHVQQIKRNVRMWFTSGAPVPNVLKERFYSVFGIPLLDYYGSSEAGNLTSTNLGHLKGTGTLLPGSSVKIFNEDFIETIPGEIGHIYAKGNGLMEGYLDEVGNASLPLLNGWLDMKDFGYFDEEGNLFVIGRHDGAIHRMGATFYPCHMERIVEELGILSKVVSFKEEKKSSFLTLFIQYPPDQSSIIRKQIISALPTYMYPDKLICIDKFPFLPNGKVHGKKLEEYALKEVTMPI